jgi:hypothetical protein
VAQLAGLRWAADVSLAERGKSSPRVIGRIARALLAEKARRMEVPLVDLETCIDFVRFIYGRFGMEPFTEQDAEAMHADWEHDRAVAFAERELSRPETPQERLRRMLGDRRP